MATYRNQKIVAYHKQWEYLSAWFQLTPINYVEDKPGIPPSPKHIELLIQQMRAEKVRVLLSTNLIGSTAPEQVAKQANAKLVMLPIAVGGEKDIKTYADLFEHIVSELETAFKE
jgi:ABC-type Zn uptake system ZnuABC Zn-binding protein ZnuA